MVPTDDDDEEGGSTLGSVVGKNDNKPSLLGRGQHWGGGKGKFVPPDNRITVYHSPGYRGYQTFYRGRLCSVSLSPLHTRRGCV